MRRRWPLHPPPHDGETLSSWVTRLATLYGMEAAELIRHDLAPPGTDPLIQRSGALDLDPPAAVLLALAERTGVPLAEVHRLTIAGQVPWLLDALDPEPEPGAAFDTYVHQDSLLLTAKERPHRVVPGWHAWLPATYPLRRACPDCVATAPVFTLVSQLPLTLTCPEHATTLIPTIGVAGTFIGWEQANTHIASEAAVSMDARTHQGLSTGTVTLPRREVHVGVWFRLLRTLIDELTAPVSALRTRSHRSVRRIWQTAGHPVRAGMVAPWHPYEALPWPRQQMLLEAAATTLDLIETGGITAHGTLAFLLTPEPHRPVSGGIPPPAVLLALAQEDPVAARQVLSTLSALTRSEASFQRIRDDLITLGIPEDYLPRTLAEQRTARPETTVTV